MDYIQINKITQNKIVMQAKNELYNDKYICKTSALILIVDSLKKIYGVRLTAKLLHGLGVEKIDLSV